MLYDVSIVPRPHVSTLVAWQVRETTWLHEYELFCTKRTGHSYNYILLWLVPKEKLKHLFILLVLPAAPKAGRECMGNTEHYARHNANTPTRRSQTSSYSQVRLEWLSPGTWVHQSYTTHSRILPHTHSHTLTKLFTWINYRIDIIGKARNYQNTNRHIPWCSKSKVDACMPCSVCNASDTCQSQCCKIRTHTCCWSDNCACTNTATVMP